MSSLRSRLLFILLFSCSLSALAAEQFEVPIKFKVNEGNMDGTEVSVIKNGGAPYKMQISSKINLKLDMQCNYIVKFSKPGYITKSIEINTNVPESRVKDGFDPFPFEVKIFKQYEGVNIVVFNQPVAKIAYSATIDDFDFNTDYTKSIQQDMKTAEEDLDKKKEEEKNKPKPTPAPTPPPPPPPPPVTSNTNSNSGGSTGGGTTPAPGGGVTGNLSGDLTKADKKENTKDPDEEKKKEQKVKEDEEGKAKLKAKTEEDAKAKLQAKAEADEKAKLSAQANEEAKAKLKAQSEEETKKRLEARAADEEKRKLTAAQNEEDRKKNLAKAEEEARQRELKLQQEREARINSLKMTFGSEEKGVRSKGGKPELVSKEVIEEKTRTITRVVIRVGTVLITYNYIKYGWGGEFYFMEDKAMTSTMYNLATALKWVPDKFN